jgi:hypothetical protein
MFSLGADRALARYVKDILQPEPGMRILDVGCGRYFRLLSGLGFDIETHVFHDLVRIPYDHFVMIARNAKKEANLYGPPDHDAATAHGPAKSGER